MKIIITLISFIYLQTTCFSQTGSALTEVNPNSGKSSAKKTTPPPSYAIIIESLPPLSQPFAEINLDLHIEGTYFFKKAEDLVIPDNYTVQIKDRATGNIFDLRSPEHHSFSVNRAMTKQFVLQVRQVSTYMSPAITLK